MYFSMCDFQVHKNRDRDYENNIKTIRYEKSPYRSYSFSFFSFGDAEDYTKNIIEPRFKVRFDVGKYYLFFWFRSQ